MTSDPSLIPGTIRPPEDRQPLLVPPGNAAGMRELEASWSSDLRMWTVERSRAPEMPRSMLPTRDRPDVAGPLIVIALVPQTSWGRNLRAVMGRDAWRPFVREHVYPTTGSVCRICGGRGDRWPVEADEVWRYDDSRGIQTLHGIVPLCPACHEVRSAGLAVRNGRRKAIVEHLSWVERIRTRDAGDRVDAALAQWASRSRRTWRIDLSLMETRYGMPMSHDTAATDDVNRRLVAEARGRLDVHAAVSPREAVSRMFGNLPR